MKRKLLKLISSALITAIVFSAAAISVFAEGSEESPEITPMMYYSMQLLGSSMDWTLREDTESRYLGKSVRQLVTLYGVGSGNLDSDGANPRLDGCLKRDLYLKYIANWVIADYYCDYSTGFFVLILENSGTSQSVLSFPASGSVESKADLDTAKEYENIKSAAAVFLFGDDDAQEGALSKLEQVSYNYLGLDWGLNDLPMYFRNKAGQQMYDACDAYEDYAANAGAGRTISATGHSLGAAQAELLSMRYDLEAVTFDAIPIVDVAYYSMPAQMSENFGGYDAWKSMDYINQIDMMGGTWERKYKNHTLCADQTVDGKAIVTLSSFWPTYKSDLKFLNSFGLMGKFEKLSETVFDEINNTGYAHSIYTIVQYDKDTDEYSLTGYKTHYASSLNYFKKNMGRQTVDYEDNHESKSVSRLRRAFKFVVELVLKATNRYQRGCYLVLGTTANDTLLGLNKNDVMYGGDGGDTLYGYAGDDTLSGGDGADKLYGGSGDDKYLFYIGGEADTFIDAEGDNALKIFGVTEKDTVSATKKDNVVHVFVNGEVIAKIDMRGMLPMSVSGFRISVCDGDGKDFAYVGSDNLGETAKEIINPRIFGELFPAE